MFIGGLFGWCWHTLVDAWEYHAARKRARLIERKVKALL